MAAVQEEGYVYNLSQARVTPLLATGEPDTYSAAITTMVAPNEASWTPVYEEKEDVVQKDGEGNVACQISQDPDFMGYDVNLKLTTREYELAAAIAGGTVTLSGTEIVGIKSPTPGMALAPFKLEIWQARAVANVGFAQRMTDGYLKTTFSFCKGRYDADSANAGGVGMHAFKIEARQNPFDSAEALEEEIVTDLN